MLFPICEKIINEEFEIYLDLEENINFKRNTSRQVHEYAFEALEHLGKPSKVKEILSCTPEIDILGDNSALFLVNSFHFLVLAKNLDCSESCDTGKYAPKHNLQLLLIFLSHLFYS